MDRVHPYSIRELSEIKPPGGCLDFRMSSTDMLVPSLDGMVLLSRRTEPRLSLESIRRAALVLPLDISLTKTFFTLSQSSRLFFFGLIRRCWIDKPSCSKSSRSPAFQDVMRRSKQDAWSLVFEKRFGFCSNSTHIVIAAFRATDSRAEPTA